MKAVETPIPGCLELRPKVMEDMRGTFVKTFNEDTFARMGLVTHFAEEYHSVSRKGVIRGMHFQAPPMEHVKLVYCLHGEVLDAVLDLRQGSPTFGRHATFSLSAAGANMVYVPEGLAHGFCVLSESATLAYRVTTVYSPEHDTGVLWSSAGIPWPVRDPIVSERDMGFPALSDFRSPFIWPKGGG